jgi:hypothetical protein
MMSCRWPRATWNRPKPHELRAKADIGNRVRGSFSCQLSIQTDKKRLVADAVYVERVSATKFPANREINRENRKIEPDAATRSSLDAATTGFLGKFPVKTNRE